MSLATPFDLAEAPARSRAIPRYAMHLALALGLLILMLLKGSDLLGDPDTQWHIAIGRWIVDHGCVPTTDLFSYTFAGAPWIAKEWISQLILFAAHEMGGWDAVVLLTSIVVAATFVWIYVWLSRQMRATAALAMTLAAFVLCEVHLLARPHVLVIPVIVTWMMVLADALEKRRAPPLWAAMLMVAWTNMHGSFPFGLVMAGVLAGEGVLLAPGRGGHVVALRRWAIFLALSAAATSLSPFGWRAILVPLMMFGNSGTLRFVNEWQPLAPDALGAIAAVVLLCTAIILLLDARGNLFRIVAVGLVAYLMVRHVRFVSLFGLIAPILAARTVAMRLPPAPTFGQITQRSRLALQCGLAAMALAVVGLTASTHPEPKANVTPRAAYAAALAHSVGGPVYNDYDFGGFLIAHGIKTFVDGRTDQLFLGDFLPDLTKAIDDKDDKAFAEIIARSKAGWALIRPRSKTSAHFDRMPGWTQVFEDDSAAVYARS